MPVPVLPPVTQQAAVMLVGSLYRSNMTAGLFLVQDILATDCQKVTALASAIASCAVAVPQPDPLQGVVKVVPLEVPDQWRSRMM